MRGALPRLRCRPVGDLVGLGSRTDKGITENALTVEESELISLGRCACRAAALRVAGILNWDEEELPNDRFLVATRQPAARRAFRSSRTVWIKRAICFVYILGR